MKQLDLVEHLLALPPEELQRWRREAHGWCRQCNRRYCKCSGAPPGVPERNPPEALDDLVASSGLPLTRPG